MSRPLLSARMIRGATVALLLGALAPSLATAQQLPIPSAGVIQDVPGATDKPEASRVYKLAVDIVTMADKPDAVSPALIGTARLINTYRAAGVPAKNIQVTAVFHGPTIALVTKDEVYKARVGGTANPNAAILKELAAAGVKFVVCGVSAREQNYQASDLAPPAIMNLSATVTFIDLQLKGYVKVAR